MNNLEIYEKARSVPQTAQKTIKGGRLNNMTDISPMWRIKKLTELFGPCGIGWREQIKRTWLEKFDGETVANVEILLFYKYEGEWSDGVPGIGGSKIEAKEKAGIYIDDEAFKKAHTDALSVACRMLGVGADVYWDKDSKYTDAKPAQKAQEKVKDITVETLTEAGIQNPQAMIDWLEKAVGCPVAMFSEADKTRAWLTVNKRAKKNAGQAQESVQ